MTPIIHPTVVVGGLSTGPEHAALYHRLALVANPHLYLTMPHHGITQVAAAVKSINRRIVDQLHTDHGVLGAPHSKASIVLIELAHEHPGMFDILVLVAGLPHGIDLGRAGHRLPVIGELAKGHELITRVEADLRHVMQHTRVVSIFTVFDQFLRWRDSYVEGGINYCFAPRIMHGVLRRLLPRDVVLVDATSDHNLLPLHPATHAIVREHAA